MIAPKILFALALKLDWNLIDPRSRSELKIKNIREPISALEPVPKKYFHIIVHKIFVALTPKLDQNTVVPRSC